MSTTPMQIDADIERHVKAVVAASGYEAQLHHASHALAQARGALKPSGLIISIADARDALHIAGEKALELQHRSRGIVDVFELMPATLMQELVRLEITAQQEGKLTAAVKDELTVLAGKIETKLAGVAKAGETLLARLTALRAQVLGRPDQNTEATVYDIADAADEQEREKHSKAAREALRKVH